MTNMMILMYAYMHIYKFRFIYQYIYVYLYTYIYIYIIKNVPVPLLESVFCHNVDYFVDSVAVVVMMMMFT
jgi:hypothetical protein